MNRPDVIVFDVNGTLSDMSAMAGRFADVGASPEAARTWFASVLRDGFALAAAGAFERFSSIAAGVLRADLSGAALTTDIESAIDHVMAGFAALGVHPDVPAGVVALAETGVRLVTLSNGSSDVAERLLTEAAIRQHFDQLLSVDDAGVWKPAAGAYHYAAQRCAVPNDRMLLVAVHPWDIDGARRAGLRTAWVDRDADAYPDYLQPPDVSVASLADLVQRLG